VPWNTSINGYTVPSPFYCYHGYVHVTDVVKQSDRLKITQKEILISSDFSLVSVPLAAILHHYLVFCCSDWTIKWWHSSSTAGHCQEYFIWQC